ncbi:hypothetical protein CORC01_13850 [Colletotrichum orchidophilum]|uniref:Uncharacterized protein n=1 Tax=Colletotrichum orchidophilum TaxID=1209926 RepID=A0A1G4ANW3_9PEZI|nr:uncharacterized protein CORC01_13850 [Colletotrichum orchidophilum]OHE90847.1 hypothetical protein CORC01_13850 [Colletotrichum orchidophilum]
MAGHGGGHARSFGNSANDGNEESWLRFAPNPSSPLSRIQTSRPTSPLSHTAPICLTSQCSYLQPGSSQVDCQTFSQSISHTVSHLTPPRAFRSPTPSTPSTSTRRKGLLYTEQTTRGGRPFKSIWYLGLEPVPNYFQLPRLVLPTVLAPQPIFPSPCHRHSPNAFHTYNWRDWLGEWRAGESPSPRNPHCPSTGLGQRSEVQASKQM